MLPTLQIGPLALQLPGLIILVGLWLGISLAERFAPRRGVPSALLYNLVFVGLISGVISARVSYIIQYPSVFAENILSSLSLNPGLFDIWGGLTGAGLAMLIYGQRRQLAFWPTLDALTPLVGVFLVSLGLSHLASGAAFGTPTTLPWGIELWGARRHPVQVYETLAAVFILAILWPGKLRGLDRFPGQYFLAFLALSAGARLFLEAFRGDSILLPGGFRLVQVIAWLVAATSLWGYRKLKCHDSDLQASNPAEKTL